VATGLLSKWKPGMELPYVIPFGENGMLAISLRAQWLKVDRSGQPLLLPPAVRAIDRLRALFGAQQTLTPGFIVSLREAMGMSQEEFGRRLGVSKMTVSRWERCRMRPGESNIAAIRSLQARARREGVRIDGAMHRRAG
jgi:DNA-binding transcriptional regulator YiaG